MIVKDLKSRRVVVGAVGDIPFIPPDPIPDQVPPSPPTYEKGNGPRLPAIQPPVILAGAGSGFFGMSPLSLSKGNQPATYTSPAPPTPTWVPNAYLLKLQEERAREIAEAPAFVSAVLSPLSPLTGITRIQMRWSHEVGSRQGLTANFLQSWYNKPVEIDISGESYMGMDNSDGIGYHPDIKVAQDSSNKKYFDKLQSSVNSADSKIPGFIRTAASLTISGSRTIFSVAAKVTSVAEKAIGAVNSVTGSIQKALSTVFASDPTTVSPHADNTIGILKTLVSYFNYGPIIGAKPPTTENYKNLRHVLILENEKGENGKALPYEVYYGYIKDLEYTEDINAPFVYTFSFKFVGLPQLSTDIKSQIEAVGKEHSSFVTTLTSSGALLKQGQGIG